LALEADWWQTGWEEVNHCSAAAGKIKPQQYTQKAKYTHYSGMPIRGHYACTSGRVISNDNVIVSEKIIKTDMGVKTVDLEIVIQQYL